MSRSSSVISATEIAVAVVEANPTLSEIVGDAPSTSVEAIQKRDLCAIIGKWHLDAMKRSHRLVDVTTAATIRAHAANERQELAWALWDDMGWTARQIGDAHTDAILDDEAQREAASRNHETQVATLPTFQTEAELDWWLDTKAKEDETYTRDHHAAWVAR